jgi:hypothetical protein
MILLRAMAVSENGDFVWGIHLTGFYKVVLLRQCFSTGESLLYDYEHKYLALSVLVAEDLQTVISGGLDQKAVLHDLNSGKTKKIIDLQYAGLFCLFRLANVVAIGDEDRVRFFDLVNRKHMDLSYIQLGGGASCMLTHKGKSKGNSVELLVGNYSPKLKQITVVDKLIKGRRNIKKMHPKVKEKLINEEPKGKIINQNMRPKIRKKRIHEELVVEIESLEEEHQLLRPQKDSLGSILSHLEGKTIQKLEARQADLESELESVKKKKIKCKEEFFNLRQELDQKKNTKLAMVS